MSFFMSEGSGPNPLYRLIASQWTEFDMIRYGLVKARGKINSSWVLTVRMAIKENTDESSNDF